MYYPLFVGVLCLSLFWYALLGVHSNFAINLYMKRELVGLLSLSYECLVTVSVTCLFLTVPWVGLQCVIVVFPNHTHFLVKTQTCIIFDRNQDRNCKFDCQKSSALTKIHLIILKH